MVVNCPADVIALLKQAWTAWKSGFNNRMSIGSDMPPSAGKLALVTFQKELPNSIECSYLTPSNLSLAERWIKTPGTLQLGHQSSDGGPPRLPLILSFRANTDRCKGLRGNALAAPGKP